jgi:hypothetical protein
MMFDWFDEPLVYYRRFAPMRSGVFDYMSRWMDSVDRAMEHQYGDFYDPFYTRTQRKPIAHQRSEHCTKTKKDSKHDKKQEEETKEQKDNNSETESESESDSNSTSQCHKVPQYYSVSTSMYSGSDGFQHIYREESDSKSGQKKVVETRRIGNKSMTLHRVTDKDGNVEEHETRKNIKDDEMDTFKKEWFERKVPTNEKKELPEPKSENKPQQNEPNETDKDE